MMEFQSIGRNRMAVAGLKSLPDPSGPMRVAQSTRRVLHVRFELKDRVAELPVARCLRLGERYEKLAAVPPDQPAQSLVFERASDFEIPGEESRIEKGRVRFHLAFIEAAEIPGAPDLVTDPELQVPQRVQNGFDRVLVDPVLKV